MLLVPLPLQQLLLLIVEYHQQASEYRYLLIFIQLLVEVPIVELEHCLIVGVSKNKLAELPLLVEDVLHIPWQHLHSKRMDFDEQFPDRPDGLVCGLEVSDMVGRVPNGPDHGRLPGGEGGYLLGAVPDRFEGGREHLAINIKAAVKKSLSSDVNIGFLQAGVHFGVTFRREVAAYIQVCEAFLL